MGRERDEDGPGRRDGDDERVRSSGAPPGHRARPVSVDDDGRVRINGAVYDAQPASLAGFDRWTRWPACPAAPATPLLSNFLVED